MHGKQLNSTFGVRTQDELTRIGWLLAEAVLWQRLLQFRWGETAANCQLGRKNVMAWSVVQLANERTAAAGGGRLTRNRFLSRR